MGGLFYGAASMRYLKGDVRSAATFLPTATPLLMYSVLLFFFGIAMYLFGVGLVIPRYLLGLDKALRPVSEWIVWYSGIPVTFGIGAAAFDLFVLLSHKRLDEPVRCDPGPDKRVTVALTAYNDEASIGEAVKEFLASPFVRSLIVVSNASTDDTMRVATEAGAITVNEPRQGYEFVRKHHAGLHSFRSMKRMEARRRKASALRLRPPRGGLLFRRFGLRQTSPAERPKTRAFRQDRLDDAAYRPRLGRSAAEAPGGWPGPCAGARLRARFRRRRSWRR